jgi:hypothetical protein
MDNREKINAVKNPYKQPSSKEIKAAREAMKRPPAENPIVHIKLDKNRKLKFTGKAFRLVEAETGKNAFNGEIFATMGYTEICVALWAGLLHEDPDLDFDYISDYVHPGNVGYITDKLIEACLGALPDEFFGSDEEGSQKSPLSGKLQTGGSTGAVGGNSEEPSLD